MSTPVPVHDGYQRSKSSGRRRALLLAPTTPDIEGPFYKEGAPFCHVLTSHPTFELSGLVTDRHGSPLDAVLDFWQADTLGHYDNSGYQFRGKVKCGPDGVYVIATAQPGDYKISDKEFRCAHIHVKVSCPGMKTLTTQLYFPGADHNDTDHWYDPTRLLRFASRTGDLAVFDFVLEEE